MLPLFVAVNLFLFLHSVIVLLYFHVLVAASTEGIIHWFYVLFINLVNEVKQCSQNDVFCFYGAQHQTHKVIDENLY